MALPILLSKGDGYWLTGGSRDEMHLLIQLFYLAVAVAKFPLKPVAVLNFELECSGTSRSDFKFSNRATSSRQSHMILNLRLVCLKILTFRNLREKILRKDTGAAFFRSPRGIERRRRPLFPRSHRRQSLNRRRRGVDSAATATSFPAAAGSSAG